MDKFRIEVINATPNPQQLIWAAMHQDYSEDFVWDKQDKFPDEERAGELIVKYLLAGNKGHFGPIEHPQITFNVGFFPHSMMQQVRTHRVGVSFDVQCLAGNSEITFLKANGSLGKIEIAELYELWTNGEKANRERKIKGQKGEAPGTDRRNCQKRLCKMKLRVFNEETRYFEIGHIKDVMYRGVQPVYRVTLEDGKVIDCTRNHRFLTVEGWKTMEKATGLLTNNQHEVIGRTQDCQFLCNGKIRQGIERLEALYPQKNWLIEQRDNGFSANTIAQQCNVSSSTIRPWAKYHGIKLLSGDQQGLKTIAGNDYCDYHASIHHNHLEAEFAETFSPMTVTQNGSKKPTSKGQKLTCHPVKVVDVQYIGEQETYDIEVEGPWHNFVANGIIVHNSNRYTGQRIIDVVEGKRDVEEVFYLRPVGDYTNRQGKKYFYSEEQRQEDLEWCLEACRRYKKRVEEGLSEEHARGLIPFDVRQHFVLSCNLRSLMHLLDLRWKKDAQLEAQQFCELLFVHFEQWAPAVAQWYLETRAKKARLSP